MRKDRAEYMREYQRKWMHERRAQWFEGKSCVKCGSTDHLEADHIDRSTKIYNISGVWSRNSIVREAELAKCQVLCYGCHKDKTSEENTTGVHGLNMYERHGCRCDICKAAKRIKNAKRYSLKSPYANRQSDQT